jgi:predicted PurR-regulated permease PerM
MRRIAGYTAVVLGTLTLLVILWQFRQAVVLFMFSLVVASAINPLIDDFLEHGLRRWASLALSYLLLLVLIALILLAVIGPLLGDLQAASNDLSLGYERLRTQWAQSEEPLKKTLAEQMPISSDLYERLSGDQRTEMLQAVVGFTGGIASFLGNLSVVIILSIYWSADRIHFERLWLSLIPVSGRIRARSSWRAIESGIGAYVRSELLQALLAGIFLWVGFYTMGIPYPMLLALFGAIAWLVPWFGGAIVFILPLLIGLAQSLTLGLLAGGYVIVVLVFLEFVIEPRFFPRQRYSSVLLLVIALVFADVFGLVGIILAPLVSAAIQISFGYILQPFISQASQERVRSQASLELSQLRARIAQINQNYHELPEEASPEVFSLIERLERLVDRVDNYTVTYNPDRVA